MKIHGFSRKLNRFLYFRSIKKRERKQLVSTFRSQARESESVKALYREAKRTARKEYGPDVFKNVPYGLCVCAIALLPLLFFHVLCILIKIPSEPAVHPELVRLATVYVEQSAAWTVALSRLAVFGYHLNVWLPIITVVALPLSLLMRRVTLLDYGRNLLLHVLQVLLAYGSVAALFYIANNSIL